MTIRGSGGITVSIWANARIPMFEAPPPSDSEVIVIGAGIAGVTCAIELARRQKRVTLLDDGPIGGGETGRTSAHLASAVDDRFCYLERTLGRDKARLVADSHAAAIDYIERVVRDRSIDCGFARVDGYLFDPPDAPSDGGIQEELAAAQRAGLACELVPRTPIEGFGGPALRFADQAQFHPMHYLAGLVEYAVELGVSIHTGVHADGIEPDDSSKERPLRVLLRGLVPRRGDAIVGALMRDGLRILACYRNDLGQCHVMSAVCPHLKGIVQWNAAEKTWDCPCHGSRFDAFGSVVNGPALANLEPVETPLADAEPSAGEYEPGSDTQPGHAR